MRKLLFFAATSFSAIIFLGAFQSAPAVFTLTARADGPGPVGGGVTISLPNPLGPCEGFDCVLKNITLGLVEISVPIFTIMVLVGGFQIMTAAGNEDRLSKGKKTILYSVVGFAILLSAYGIVSIIQEVLSTGGS